LDVTNGMRAVGFLVALLGAVGCVQHVTMQSTFNPAEVQWAKAEGDNTIQGSALLRTMGGEVRTCAGLAVVLIPVTRFASEHMKYMYGTWRSGFFPAQYEGLIAFDNDDRRYYYSVLHSTCDAEGRFEFERLPKGEFYVETSVVWMAGNEVQGGRLMQRVQTEGGRTQKIVLTN
jgi:hypothetical protein